MQSARLSIHLTPNYKQLLLNATTRLSALGIEDARLDAELLLAAAAHISVFITTKPRMNIRRPNIPFIPPRLAAVRNNET